jgi:acylphosphatase
MPEPVKTPVSMPLSTDLPMNAEMPATIRKRFIVKGRVQRVGYRALVLAFADSMGLKGLVRNLADKTVEVVCEGPPKDIAAFLKAIDRKGDPMDPVSINVTSLEEAPPPPEGELAGFIIDYGRKLTPIERESLDRDEIMILGAGILNIKVDGLGQKFDGLGQKFDGLGQKFDGLGQKVDNVGNAVRDMHGDMNVRFDHVAQKYDMIAASLKEAIVHMDRNAEKTDRAIERSRKQSASEANRTRYEIARSRKQTILAVHRSEERTAKMHKEGHRELAASNRELAGVFRFMIRKLTDRPAVMRPGGKRTQ